MVKNAFDVLQRIFFLGFILLILGIQKLFLMSKQSLIILSRISLVGLIFFNLILFYSPRMLNWGFVIGFVVVGLTLSSTFFFIGLIFVMVGILISPYVSDFVHHIFQVNYPFSHKVIITFLGLVVAITLLLFNEQYDDKRFLTGFLLQLALLDIENEEHLEQFQIFMAQEEFKQRKKEYLETHEQLHADLQSLYDKQNYQKVVHQGTPYVRLDSQIQQLVVDANTKLREQQVKKALKQIPKLLKARQYWEAYHLAAPLREEASKLGEFANEAKKYIDKEVNKLRSLYERGRYQQVINKGKLLTDSDCRVDKLVSDSREVKARVEKRKDLHKTIQRTSNYMKRRKYQQAIDFAKQSEYAKHPRIQTLINRAKFQLKKAREKNILARLRNIPSTEIESNIREYAKLLQIFSENEKYQRKLAYYKDQLDQLRRQPPLLVTQAQYGDKWPFTVPEGKLECLPPGILTFRVNNQTYAVNNLASSRGYKDITPIWREIPQTAKIQSVSITTKVDMLPLINRGLELCQPLE